MKGGSQDLCNMLNLLLLWYYNQVNSAIVCSRILMDWGSIVFVEICTTSHMYEKSLHWLRHQLLYSYWLSQQPIMGFNSFWHRTDARKHVQIKCPTVSALFSFLITIKTHKGAKCKCVKYVCSVSFASWTYQSCLSVVTVREDSRPGNKKV